MNGVSLDATIRAVVREVLVEELAHLRPAPAPDLVTVAEYARRKSISPSTVRAAIRDGRLAVERIGRAVRVPAAATIGRSADRVAKAAAARDVRRARLIGGR